MLSGVRIVVLPHDLSLSEHYRAMTQTSTELQGIMIIKELSREAKLAIHVHL